MIIKTIFKKKQYSEAELVEGVFLKKKPMQSALFEMVKKYYYQHYKGVFFAQEADADDIFQNTIITMIQNIERKKIYAEGGVVIGKDNKPLSGTLGTYFMGIAKLKFKEWTRSAGKESNLTDISSGNGSLSDLIITEEWYSEDDETIKKEIVSDCISKMSERCRQILTMFYEEEKSLDIILMELPSFNSKDALKTAKNKCLGKLKTSTNDIYSLINK